MEFDGILWNSAEFGEISSIAGEAEAEGMAVGEAMEPLFWLFGDTDGVFICALITLCETDSQYKKLFKMTIVFII